VTDDGHSLDKLDRPWCEPMTTTLINPATGAELREVPSTSAQETDAAIERAHDAFVSWRAVAPGERARLLRSFAAVVDAHVEELARLEVQNSGHTIGNARWEAGNVRDCLNYYSAAPERLFGRQIPVPGGVDVTFREPLGVVSVIVPWNFPMPIAGWGFAPALAAGNTVVLKPAEITPLTAMRIAELALEAGLPEGVFTVLPGRGSVVGQRFVTHPLVRKVCFTGSTEVGKQIMAGCADQVKRVTLELGGKSANIVFADADVARAAATAPYAVFDNAGQDCCARSRILVERSAYDEFVGHLEAAVRALKVIDPEDEQSEMGPLVSARQRDSVQAYIDGASIAFQGAAPGGDGFWLPPTVVESTSTDEAVWREEVFGPVVAVMAFDDEAEAVALANDTEYGLSGSIYTRDLGRALRVARGVESGNLSVNSHSSVRYWTPFGGFKQSGLGRELGPDAPNAFTEEKNVFFSDQ
jgi:betaine-aldehyde dehydrogenase